jgi:hypothetical protein
MNLPRIDTAHLVLAAAVTSTCLWSAKSVAIGLAGGLDKSPAEGPLFLLGLLAHLTGWIALAVWSTRGRTRGIRTAVVAATVPAVVLATLVIQLLIGVLEPADPAWFWSELNLWVLSVALLVLATSVVRRSAGVAGLEAALSDFR